MSTKCPFFLKVGICKHGNTCSKDHPKPKKYKTILLKNLYFLPTYNPKSKLSDSQIKTHTKLFYEELFTEISLNYSPIKNMIILSNISDHLIGNVYIEFFNYCNFDIDFYYNFRRVIGIPTFITQFEICDCDRGIYCNFLHPIHVDNEFINELMESQRIYYNSH